MMHRLAAPVGVPPTDDITVALVADLRDLARGLLSSGYTRTTIALLDRNLHRGAPSALGASLVVDRGDDQAPLRLDLVRRTVEPGEIASAIRIHLDAVLPGVRGWVDVFASAVGAFDQLAPGLARQLAGGRPPLGHGSVTEIRIEEPPTRPTRPLVPGLTGLTDYSRVDHAFGILLNRGYGLPEARQLLHDRAQENGTDVETVAVAIIDWS